MGKFIIKEITPVINATQFSINDVLFTTIEIPKAIPAGRSAILRSIAVLDEDYQGIIHDVFILRSNADFGTMNSTIAASDAVMAEVLAIVQFHGDDFYDLINSKFAIQAGSDSGIGTVLRPTDKEQTSLWFAGVTRGVPSHAVGGLIYKIGLEIT